jgi:CheY-like chemotaxis protein
MRLEIETITAPAEVVNDAVAVDESYQFETNLKNGIAAAQSGDREKARTLLADAADINPQSEDVWMWLASISEYPEELLAFLNNVLQVNPANRRAVEWQKSTRSLVAKTLVQRGIDAHQKGTDDQARLFFEQAIANDEMCEMAWFWLARVATIDGDSVSYLNRVLEINPDNQDARRTLDTITGATVEETLRTAKKAAMSGKHKKAVSIIDEVLSGHPDNSEAWLLRSHFSTDVKEKLNSLQKALELDPENAAARFNYEFLISSMCDTDVPVKDPVHSVVDNHPQAEITNQDEVGSDLENTTDAVSEAPYQEAFDAPQTVSEAPDHVVPELSYQETFEAADLAASEFPYQAAAEATDQVVSEVTNQTAECPEDHLIEMTSPDHMDMLDEHEPTGEAECPPIIDPEVLFTHEPVMVVEEPQNLSTASEATCAYCQSLISSQNIFECDSCLAVLTLSDLEALLSTSKADAVAIQVAVSAMEADWNLSEFDAEQLTTLAIGHFNLGNFDIGLKYLQDAARLDPNNVILSGQVNALAIRIDEMRRQSESQDTQPKGRSILVIDDSPTVRKLLTAKLEKSGHKVVCAGDGVEGLERLAEQLPDLVLLDIGMPRMDGYEVCRQIRANPLAGDLPVVMISGKDGFFDKVRGRMAGTTGYVTKPFGPETLMRALETYLLPVETDNNSKESQPLVTNEASLNM